MEELPSEGRLLDPNLPRPTTGKPHICHWLSFLVLEGNALPNDIVCADLEAHNNGQEEKPTGKGSRILGNVAMSDGAWAAF